jgi:DNA-binding transcriptional regulator YdaS (Cro superfamily)
MSKKNALQQYWDRAEMPLRREVAEKAGVSYLWLYQLANGYGNASPKIAVAIEKATGGIVKRADILPDIFG